MATLRDTRKIAVDWAKVDDLGKVSDLKVARRLGLSDPTVRRNRQRLGIAPSWQSKRQRRERIADAREEARRLFMEAEHGE